MAYDPLTIAARFTQLANVDGKTFTQMQLQKLTYIAHGFKLAATAGQPMVSDEVNAWKFGPVFPELYHALKYYGGGGVPAFLPAEKISDLDDSIIQAVYHTYGNMSGIQLSERTHMQGTPWYQIWHGENGRSRNHAVIPNEVIMNYYRGLFSSSNATNANVAVA